MAAGSWPARLRLHPNHPSQPAGCGRSKGRSGSTHNSRERRRLGGRNLACKTASPPQPPPQPAGCSRSQGRSGSTHNSRERRHLGGRNLACKTASPFHPPLTASRMLALPGAIRQHTQLPGAPPSWRQDLGLQDGVSIPTNPHGQQDAGAPRDDQAARTTPGSAAVLAAGTWLARQRLHPNHPHSQQDARAPRGDQAAHTTPGSAAILAAGPWPARRRLHPHHPHGQPDAGAPRGDQSAHTTPGSAAVLAAGPWLARRRLHPSRPAGCWRSQGRSGSTHNSRERRHLGGRNLACKTAPPSPPHLPRPAGCWRSQLVASHQSPVKPLDLRSSTYWEGKVPCGIMSAPRW